MAFWGSLLCTLSLSNDTSFILDEPFTLQEKAQASNEDLGLSLSWHSLFDARCPDGYECSSKGYSHFDVDFSIGETAYEETVKQKGNQPLELTFASNPKYSVSIINVEHGDNCSHDSSIKAPSITVIVSAIDVHQVCTTDYSPVCAIKKVAIECATEPCPPLSIYKTYSNQCNATKDDAVFAFEGECEDEQSASL